MLWQEEHPHQQVPAWRLEVHHRGHGDKAEGVWEVRHLRGPAHPAVRPHLRTPDDHHHTGRVLLGQVAAVEHPRPLWLHPALPLGQLCRGRGARGPSDQGPHAHCHIRWSREGLQGLQGTLQWPANPGRLPVQLQRRRPDRKARRDGPAGVPPRGQAHHRRDRGAAAILPLPLRAGPHRLHAGGPRQRQHHHRDAKAAWRPGWLVRELQL
mmetsp:Transcript_132440/g.369219  ORF Transcript_132440/g.369219 Transcript_132440/m.369219 type:complete len:210 (+) Transcript_132440:1005-1634(+)